MERKDVWTVMIRIGDEMRLADLVYLDGVPHVVWEWHEQAANEHPGVTIPLDPRHLQETPGFAGQDFVYGPPIQAPDAAS